MAQSVMVVATEAGTGKSVISLGLVDQLERHGARTAYFKPVGLTNGTGVLDPDARFVHQTLKLRTPVEWVVGAGYSDVTRAIEGGRYDELVDRILEAHARLAREVDIVVCEGVDSTGAFPALDSDINIDLAKNLDAPIVLVTSGRRLGAEDIATNIMMARNQLHERGAEVSGVFVNRVEARKQGEIADDLRRLIRDKKVTLYGVLPELNELSKPRMRDVVRALEARILQGDDLLDTQVGTVLVAAMGLENALHYFEDGCLVITPGDREEILLAAASSYACANVPRPAGVVLSGGFEPRRKVLQLVHGLSQGRLPILQVGGATYETAIAVNGVQPVLSENQEDKALAIRGAMEEYVDLERLVGKKLAATRKVITPRRFLRDLRDMASTDKKTIVLPEGNVDRILKAAEELRRQDIVNIAIIGDENEIRKQAAQIGVRLDDGVTIVNPRADKEYEDYVKTLLELRKHKGLPEDMARDLMSDRTYFGTMMVYKGRADGMVSGSTTTTQATLRPAFEFVKTKPGINCVSSVFFMCLPDRVLVYGDCAVIPNPTVEQLSEIALASADTAQAFGIEPRVAMLSYSTGSSGKGEDVDRVREATALVREHNPKLMIEGPIQYDAAIDPSVARTKLPDSQVAGQATVFIFPDLNTGNNTYKAVQRSAGAIAIGPVLQGLRKPVNDLSRGATVTDIVNTVIVTAIQARQA